MSSELVEAGLEGDVGPVTILAQQASIIALSSGSRSQPSRSSGSRGQASHSPPSSEGPAPRATWRGMHSDSPWEHGPAAHQSGRVMRSKRLVGVFQWTPLSKTGLKAKDVGSYK